MRPFLLLFLLLLTYSVTAQDFDNKIKLNYDSLKIKSVSFDEAWKYSAGDNDEWSKQYFDDSDWDTLNPKLKWNEFNDSLWNGIGWFRKNIVIDSSLFNKTVTLSANHYGASEIYLNGEEVIKFGTVSVNPDSEKVYHPNNIPVVLTFGPDSAYVLSVRYSNHQSVSDPEWIDQWFGNLGFSIRIHEANKRILSLVNNGKSNFGVNLGIGGIFLSLAILYFLLHLFYSNKRENLYYALFSFSLSLLFVSSMLGNLVFENLTWIVVFKLISITGVSLAFLGYLGFIYSIFYKKMPKQIWFFVFGTILLGVMLFNNSLREYANYGLPLYIFLATIEGLRSIIIAIKNKKDHSWVIGTGVIIFVLLIVIIFVINLFGLQPEPLLILIVFMVGLFSLPSSMSVYLARSIASTNKKLAQQVEEIKDLSDRELAAQKRNNDLILETEREKAAKNEAMLSAKTAELQAKASEAERRILEAENDRKTRELEEARSLQLSLLPKIIPSIPGLEISVYMETATEVGGDYYDFYKDPNGELTVLIGDATGHGLNAGTVVTATKSLFNSHANNPDILDTFNKMSNSLKLMNFRLLSMCLMLLKIQENKLRLSSAGMPPALIYREDKKEVEEFLIRGMPLGTANSFPYQLRETSLNKGDTILLMSDGFPELFNERKEMFGYGSVQKEFLQCGGQSTELVISHLKKKIAEWSSGETPDDDVTLVVIKMK